MNNLDKLNVASLLIKSAAPMPITETHPSLPTDPTDPNANSSFAFRSPSTAAPTPKTPPTNLRNNLAAQARNQEEALRNWKRTIPGPPAPPERKPINGLTPFLRAPLDLKNSLSGGPGHTFRTYGQNGANAWRYGVNAFKNNLPIARDNLTKGFKNNPFASPLITRGAKGVLGKFTGL